MKLAAGDTIDDSIFAEPPFQDGYVKVFTYRSGESSEAEVAASVVLFENWRGAGSSGRNRDQINIAEQQINLAGSAE